MTRAALGLGANLADARAALRGAVAGLAEHPAIEVVAVSGLWRTAPVGGPDQPDYLNAVVVVDTELSAAELLSTAQALERAAGRTRTVRWGPRTLDVDILDVAGSRSARADLTLPHPRAHERAFVLAPWAEVDPDRVLQPAGGPARPIRAWRDDIVDQAVELIDAGEWWR